MPGIARQFEPQITRSGGIPAKYCFTVRCSACTTTETYEARRSVSDADVRRYFDTRGWVLGRRRSDDLCTACLETSGDARPPRPRNEPRPASVAPVRQADSDTVPTDKRHRDTADILARHLGRPEALAAEVFRPKEVQSLRPGVPEEPPPSASALSPEVEQALAGMASDLKSLRSTLELIAEQVSQLVAIGGQQIEAIACLSPLMSQAADGISSGLKEIVSAVGAIPAASTTVTKRSARDAETDKAQDQEKDVELGPVEAQVTSQPARRARGPRTSKSPLRQKTAGAISVKSIPDATRPERFYTTIRLPRELWNRSGFGPNDRIQLDWTKKTLSITRAAEGGVKPKTIGTAVVVLQSWRLGALTFDKASIASGDGSLRLTVGS